MRLIDADALSAEVDKSKYHNPHSQGLVSVNHRNEHDHFIKMINDAPTVDAVEVVRCKDCIFAERNEEYRLCYTCEKPLYYPQTGERPHKKIMQDCDFCSHGKRRK